MTPEAWIVAAIVGGAMVLFVSEKLRFDVIALLVLVLLMVTGILKPSEGLSGFSNEATVVVTAMFALNAGVVGTGGLDPLIRVLSRIRRSWLLTLAILVIVSVLGAFVKNTALVATFLPVVLGVCVRARISPARVLMPMSYAAQMGGVCTLLGTSSNLIANSLAVEHGLPPFSVFEFARLGVPLALAGIVYLMLVGRWLLPRHIDVETAENFALGKFVTELKVMPGSPLIGQAIGAAGFAEKYGVHVLELLRGATHLWAPRDQQLRENDVLIARGDWDRLADFQRAQKLELAPVADGEAPNKDERRILIEAMVAPGARLIGDTLERADFPWNYKAGLESSKAQLLQRYLLISHLAPELAHGFKSVRDTNGVTVDLIVTCGNLPELRSMTLPLIEELDVEVETLDSTDGLVAAGGLATGEFTELVPALRLATAAACATGAVARRDPMLIQGSRFAAAAAVIAALAWVGYSYWHGSQPVAGRHESAQRREPALPSVDATTSTPAQLPTQPVPSTPDPAPQPVATRGSDVPNRATSRTEDTARRTLPEQSRPVPSDTRKAATPETSSSGAPLDEPLPRIDTVLIDQNRRLAILDGAVVGVGDPIGSRVVVAIAREAILLREPSGRIVRVRARVGM